MRVDEVNEARGTTDDVNRTEMFRSLDYPTDQRASVEDHRRLVDTHAFALASGQNKDVDGPGTHGQRWAIR